MNNFQNLLSQQGNTILVDTPGFGGTKEFTNNLMNYLPNAVSFIFVTSVERAGGMQDDRVKNTIIFIVVKESAYFLVTISKNVHA